MIKKENDAIKDRIITDIRNVFEYEEEHYYNPVIVGNFWSNNYINMKVTVIEIKYYQLKNILTKLYILKGCHK